MLCETSGMDWSIESVASAEEFLARSASFRNAHPMETNVIGSVATSVADGNKTYQYCFWWIVLAENEVVGIAMRTAPYRLMLSSMPEGSARRLAKAVLDVDPSCWGATGPKEAASEFIESWCDGTGEAASDYPLYMQETIYLLARHTPRADVLGAARKADDSDIPLLLNWLPAFAAEAGLFHVEAPTEAELQSRLRATSIFIWEVDGRPVAMAGHAPIISGPGGRIGRIGPVYTEPDERGHGYGAAVTSSMIDHLHSMGCSSVMLYADVDYEKSNRVYRGLGFRPVGTIVEFGVAPKTDEPA